jgi:hypothetical protein
LQFAIPIIFSYIDQFRPDYTTQSKFCFVVVVVVVFVLGRLACPCPAALRALAWQPFAWLPGSLARAAVHTSLNPHVSNFDWTVVWQVVRRDGDQVRPGRGNTGDA